MTKNSKRSADSGESPRPCEVKNRVIAHEQLVRHIRQAIGSGRLAPGEQLRLREAFRQDFDLSNTTIQKAFTRLAEDGFIVTRGRLGTFVAERPPNLFRMALAFNRPKAQALADKHCLALATAASTFEEQGGKALASYYSYADAEAFAADPRLFDDLDAERLAGVIWIAPTNMVAARSRSAADSVPNVFCQAIPLDGHYPDETGVSAVLLSGFTRRAVEEIVRLGGRRVAVLAHSHDRAGADEFGRTLQEAGRESSGCWRIGIDVDNPAWAMETVQLLFSLPEDRRPDSLIVANDHLAESAIAGLAGLGLLGKVKLVCHANFPLSAPSPVPVRRIGFDCREVLRACVEAVDRLNARRRGVAAENEDARPAGGHVRIEVSARADYEIAATPRLSPATAFRVQ